MILKTLNYGKIPIAKKNNYILDFILDNIEDSMGNYYEIRKTTNNQIVALLVE